MIVKDERLKNTECAKRELIDVRYFLIIITLKQTKGINQILYVGMSQSVG